MKRRQHSLVSEATMHHPPPVDKGVHVTCDRSVHARERMFRASLKRLFTALLHPAPLQLPRSWVMIIRPLFRVRKKKNEVIRK